MVQGASVQPVGGYFCTYAYNVIEQFDDYDLQQRLDIKMCDISQYFRQCRHSMNSHSSVLFVRNHLWVDLKFNINK